MSSRNGGNISDANSNSGDVLRNLISKLKRSGREEKYVTFNIKRGKLHWNLLRGISIALLVHRNHTSSAHFST